MQSLGLESGEVAIARRLGSEIGLKVGEQDIDSLRRQDILDDQTTVARQNFLELCATGSGVDAHNTGFSHRRFLTQRKITIGQTTPAPRAAQLTVPGRLG